MFWPNIKVIKKNNKEMMKIEQSKTEQSWDSNFKKYIPRKDLEEAAA